MASLNQWHEFEQAPGDREGQGSLVCCSPWGRKEPDLTEQLNNNNKSENKLSLTIELFDIRVFKS